jgi:NAD+ synthase
VVPPPLSLAETIAPRLGLTADQVRRVFADIDKKRKATRYLHAPPLLIEPLPKGNVHVHG